MSLRESIDPWLLRAAPPGSRRFVAAQLGRDALGRRASLRELWNDAPIGATGTRFRRWLADRPLPPSDADASAVVIVDEPWEIPDVAEDSMLVFTRAGDSFREGALRLIAEAAGADGIDLVHWDDALLDDEGQLTDPRFRPSWAPEQLLAVPYLGRSFAIRRSRLDPRRLPGPESGDQWLWGLLLGCRFEASEVARIPHVLAGVVDRSDAADTRVANRHLAELGLEAAMGRSGAIGWDPAVWPPVTIVIPTRHNRRHLDLLLPRLSVTSHPDFQVVVVDNGPQTAANEQYYETDGRDLDLAVRWWEQPFNYSAVNNFGAGVGDGEYLVFLNDDALPLHPTWLQNLVGWLALEDVGTVGAFLVDDSGRIDHAGIVVGMHSLAGHLMRDTRPGESTLFGPVNRLRNVMAVTGACTAIRRSVFDQLGGFDERFALTGSDVALGVAAVEAGLRNVCTPWSRLRHQERSTRGGEDPAGDIALTRQRLEPWLEAGDPWYSPNLSLRSTRPQLRSRGEIRA